MKHLIGPVRSILDERKQMIDTTWTKEQGNGSVRWRSSIRPNADEEASRILLRKPGTGLLPQSTREGSGRRPGRRRQKMTEEADRSIALEREM